MRAHLTAEGAEGAESLCALCALCGERQRGFVLLGAECQTSESVNLPDQRMRIGIS